MELSNYFNHLQPLAQVLSQIPLERLLRFAKSPGPVVQTTTEPESAPIIEDLFPPRLDLPTTQDTVTELKRRLGKELYRLELDLVAGCKIMGKPCDCCGDKHQFGVEATAEELVPMDQDPIYRQVIAWYQEHAPAMTAEASASGEYDDRYPEYAKDVRKFRKLVLRTENIATLVEEAKKQAIGPEGMET